MTPTASWCPDTATIGTHVCAIDTWPKRLGRFVPSPTGARFRTFSKIDEPGGRPQGATCIPRAYTVSERKTS